MLTNNWSICPPDNILLRMKQKIQWMIAILAVASLPAVATTWDQYRVVLKDGSWLTASEKPQLGENQAEALTRWRFFALFFWYAKSKFKNSPHQRVF